MIDIGYYYPIGHEAHFEEGHPERPERVEVIRDALRKNGLWNDQTVSPFELSDDYIRSVHSAAYLNLLELTCKRGGHLDGDTYTTPASWSVARNSAGGAIAIANAVWDGEFTHGFALTRPPGHHAMRGQGMGFCLLNNIAVAAEFLITNKNAKCVAIVDLDLHHGNGTQEIFWDRDDVLYISIHQIPLYPGTGLMDEIGVGKGRWWTANFPIPPRSGDKAYLAFMDEIILPLLDQRSPEIILVSYGFDPHWMDPLGQLLLTADGYGKLVKCLSEWANTHCQGKVALFLEGGYDLKAAETCSIAVSSALSGREWIDTLPCPYTEGDTWRSALLKAHQIWDL